LAQVVHAFVQARLGSTRLPGKVLLPIGRTSLLCHVLSGISASRMIDDGMICVPKNDRAEIHAGIKHIAPIAKGDGFDGPDDDLAGRFLYATDVLPCDHFVRICADSPLIHPALIDLAVATHLSSDAKVTQLPGFPRGEQVQVYDVAYLRAAYPRMTPQQREHCIVAPMPRASVNNKINLCVDTQADYERIKALMESLPKPHWEMTWPELFKAVKND